MLLQIDRLRGAILLGSVFRGQDFDDFPAMDGDAVVVQCLAVGFDGITQRALIKVSMVCMGCYFGRWAKESNKYTVSLLKAT